MFAQITAIAREFNFPSVTGICLYYQYSEDGLTLTPRISDDSWQTIWAHLSEPTGPNEKRPLISGKIEFDIDHRIARWYGAWISSIFREVSEMNHYPATAPSYGHARAESRTTLPDGRVFDEDDGSVIIQQSAPVTVTRHIPRKLSLVERFETASVRAEFKSAPRSIGTPPENLPSASQAPVLSPIVQEEEPKTARQDLNSRVKSWRASAILTPTPLAATGQTSLEPVNLPNTMEAEMQMEDFTWSISSPGPSSYAERSPLVSEYSHIPSVHLDRRLKGSVCSTPSIRTSFGPSDYDPFSPTFLAFDEHIPSPDIAQRFFEDSPPTPLTATSWGAPLSYPPSPRNFEIRVPSPDIAQRMYEDSPSTPMTATSWGAPLSYPPSPRCASPVPSVDLGERSRFDDVASQHSEMSHSMWRASLTRAVRRETPITNWTHVWPYTEQKDGASAPAARGTFSVWPHVWPYNRNTSLSHRPQLVATWQHVWPYNARLLTGSLPGEQQLILQPRVNFSSWIIPDIIDYPYNLQHIYPPPAAHRDENAYPYNLANLYPSAPSSLHATSAGVGYPYNLANIYPPATASRVVIIPSQRLGYPHHLYNIYSNTFRDLNAYPHNLTRIYALIPVTRRSAESQGYPHNLTNIYPAVTDAVVDDKLKAVSWVGPLESYPYNLSQIYPPGYPQNLANIYPAVCTNQNPGLSLGVETATYPHNLMLIYPPITRRATTLARSKVVGYPHNLSNIYPPVNSRSREVVSKVQFDGYPHHLNQLYPPVYPHNLDNIYPSVHRVEWGIDITASFSLLGYPYNLARIYPAVTANTLKIASETGQPGYPHNLGLIYPPISRELSPGYPHNLAAIYPAVNAKPVESGPTSTMTGYPHNLRMIYPPIAHTVLLGYPHNLTTIYPAVDAKPVESGLTSTMMSYPHNLLLIYPPIAHNVSLGYPHNLANLYPASTKNHKEEPSRNTHEFDGLSLGYPHNLSSIYPALADRHRVSSARNSSIGYPHNLAQIYAPVYPYNLDILYSPVYDVRASDAGFIKANLMSVSPTTDYYPFNLMRIYPPCDAGSKVSTQKSSGQYPYNLLNIYPPVDYAQAGYPHNLATLYPPMLYGQFRGASGDSHSDYPFFNLCEFFYTYDRFQLQDPDYLPLVDPSKTPLRFAHYYLHLCNPRGQYPHFELCRQLCYSL
jgi:hypothetical protein